MTTPKPGERWRITETYSTGTTITYEGVIASVRSDGDVAWLDGAGMPFLCDKPNLRPSVTVTVERLRDPLPTAPGSVIKVENASGVVYLMLSEFEDWVSTSNTRWTTQGLGSRDDVTVILDASTEA